MRIVPFRIIHTNIQPMRNYRKAFETEYSIFMALICIKPNHYNDGAARNTAKHKHRNGPCGPTWSRLIYFRNGGFLLFSPCYHLIFLYNPVAGNLYQAIPIHMAAATSEKVPGLLRQNGDNNDFELQDIKSARTHHIQ